MQLPVTKRYLPKTWHVLTKRHQTIWLTSSSSEINQLEDHHSLVGLHPGPGESKSEIGKNTMERKLGRTKRTINWKEKNVVYNLYIENSEP